MNEKNKILIITMAAVLVVAACSSKLERKDDAVRIVEDSVKHHRWNYHIQQFRNGKTLRGTVLGAKVVATPQPCPEPVDTTYNSYIVFVDDMSKDGHYEYIPFDAVEFPGDSLGIHDDSTVAVENFNNPRGIKALRKIRIDTIWNDCNPCNCRDFDLPEFELNLPTIKISCIDRNYFRTFLEIKGGYQLFTDKLFSGEEQGRAGWSGEIATGIRFGDEDNSGTDKWNPPFALGLTYSTGVNTLNTLSNENITRPAVLFYGRYQSPDNRLFGLCMRPFVYGQLGFTIDKLTMDLFRINWCDECKECGGETDYPAIEGQPNVDWDIPISWGLGTGVDIPLAPFMDLSFDVGYRSLAFGDKTSALNLIVPTGRRIDMFLFRMGLTF